MMMVMKLVLASRAKFPDSWSASHEGYWNRPDETEKSCSKMASSVQVTWVMDTRGYFKIVDRKKDMILVSGFNVYPSEIEEVDCEASKKVLTAAGSR